MTVQETKEPDGDGDEFRASFAAKPGSGTRSGDHGILERSLMLGEHMMKRLSEMAGRTSAIGDVRGLGWMVAMELFRSRSKHEARGR